MNKGQSLAFVVVQKIYYKCNCGKMLIARFVVVKKNTILAK